ncbi:MAG TPA: hypothetical protein VNH22_13605, partial [Blastocatellia bacterium]|nr:hypothetical protein [Blastocatellia bacterium]
MNAVISGRAGTALLINGDLLQSLDVGDPDTLVPRRQSEVPFLFADSADLQFLENIDPLQVKKELELACNSSLALDLMLILLDVELSIEVRTEASTELEELFADSKVIESLESILYAKPLPKIADLEGALDCCSQSKAPITRTFLKRLEEHQTAIREVSLVWESIPETIFGGSKEKTEFHQTALREGLFRKLAVARDSVAKLNPFLVTSLSNNAVRKLPNHRDVLQRWVEPFRQQVALPELTPEAYQEDEREIP